VTANPWADVSPPYRTIVADPPWKYQKDPGAKQPEQRGGRRGGQAERVYSTMTNEELLRLPVDLLADDEAHLYLWVTNPGMFGGRFSDVTPADIAGAWGFEFQTMLTWVKAPPGEEPAANGMGWYFRGATEHVLFATRGKLGIPAGQREVNVVMSRRSGHSVKPGAFYDRVERVSPGPRIELFARQPRLGWDAWGFGIEPVDATSG
jgi:N6-adenosine-specific RNA methylase IME4